MKHAHRWCGREKVLADGTREHWMVCPCGAVRPMPSGDVAEVEKFRAELEERARRRASGEMCPSRGCINGHHKPDCAEHRP